MRCGWCVPSRPLISYGPREPLMASLRAWNRLGVGILYRCPADRSWGLFCSFEGVFCLCRGVCFLHYPLACEKYHIAPQLCQKKKDTEEKWRWMGVRVSQLSAWRLALKDTGSAETPYRF